MSSRYRSIFPRRQTFLAVIHAEDIAQVINNARIAFGEGADGIFLVNHTISSDNMESCYGALREMFQTGWVGFNWLRLSHRDAFQRMRPSMGGMWVDNAGIYDDEKRTREEAGQLAIHHRQCEDRWHHPFLLFGGVAFKYQHEVDPAKAAKAAIPYMDVITTSGKGTGYAANIRKIQSMKKAAGDHPLAIASGITPENVLQYPDADCFIVGTYLCEPETEKFTVPRMKAMRNAIPM